MAAGVTRRNRWGRREYFAATTWIRATGHLGALKTVIGVLCLSMVVLGTVVQFHPLGPHGLDHRLVHGTIVASALFVGMWWIFRPWPSYRAAVAFVIWGDLSIAVCAILTSAPAAQLNATSHMGLLGVFATVLLGWRVLVAHSAFATAVIVGITAWAVVGEHSSLMELYIYYAPALSAVVGFPMIIQALIEGGRRSINSTARSAVRDPLTGLFNRRGMQSTVRAALDTLVRPTFMAVAVIDLDGFKTLNDTHGHRAGDAALREIAQRLRDFVRHDGDLVARTGGDEFVVIAYLDTRSGLDSFIDRCAALRFDPLSVSASIGVACLATSDPHFDFENLLSDADMAMYQAKRRGGQLVILHADSAA